MKRFGFGALLVALAMLGTTVGVPVSADVDRGAQVQTTADSFTNVLVKGTTDDGEKFRGRMDIRRFVAEGGEIVAVGLLDGRMRDASGETIGTVTDKRVRMPVSAITAKCDILHLELGPLDLDILGLVVHINRIVIDIDAVPGAGNLIGNLLCAIAHLLDEGIDLDAAFAELLTAVAKVLRLLQRL
ncbi:MAG: hypothetical protein ACRDJV_10360 [Actinomycetota bacterium]